MSAWDYKELVHHVGHDLVCVSYADGENVAVECETCNEVLFDYDRPNKESEEDTSLPLFRVEFTSVADVYVHAQDEHEAREIASEKELDWYENTCWELTEKVDDDDES